MSDTVSLPSTEPSAGADTLNVSVLSVESRVITLLATSLPPNVRSELVDPSAFFGVIIIDYVDTPKHFINTSIYFIEEGGEMVTCSYLFTIFFGHFLKIVRWLTHR